MGKGEVCDSLKYSYKIEYCNKVSTELVLMYGFASDCEVNPTMKNFLTCYKGFL